MILFFKTNKNSVVAIETNTSHCTKDIEALKWLLGKAEFIESDIIKGEFIGPSTQMVSPWSTTAVEITINMNISGITRMEEFYPVTDERSATYDKMLQRIYKNLGQDIFKVEGVAEEIEYIDDISLYNKAHSLALSNEEVEYLNQLSIKLNRKLTDSEVFGFSQINSEHCRHKIFNGEFVINGVAQESSLFNMIKATSKVNPNRIVSAYKDNCAILEGPEVSILYTDKEHDSHIYATRKDETVITLKAETHNFPTTVEPFNGGATGSGGEIRDRMAGGRGSFPLAGTSVYMTSYPRPNGEEREWENIPERDWLYQSPEEILTKASNGASDFGNKFGQPLICGSLLTFEHIEGWHYGYDKVIMMAGGIGYAKRDAAIKSTPQKGDKIVVMGGDNYRIGMGGGAVSSVATGQFKHSVELNAIQRSNPEMQKRVYNVIRYLAENNNNPIVTVHDHGAGGHLNSISELVESSGGVVYIDKLPIGDKTLSYKEILCNESQERMGLIMKESDIEEAQRVANRESAPLYIVGEVTGDHNFTVVDSGNNNKPVDLKIDDLLGSTPKTVMEDAELKYNYDQLEYDTDDAQHYAELLMQIEAVACKDWLTNKVDRSVSGLIALQQTAGEIQLPLNNLGVVAIGHNSSKGIATSIGHAPAAAIIDPQAGSRLAIAEALTNIIWTPIEQGIKGISLSANWMWPCKNTGEDTRLYKAVKAASDFAIELGLNIPTGKDSLSMTQKYPDDEKVLSPGTVIISAVAEASNIKNTIKPVFRKNNDSVIIHIPFNPITPSWFELGGSSFAQVTNQLGRTVPDITDSHYFVRCFNAIQEMVEKNLILAGHDISAGGILTTLLEMSFANSSGGFDVKLEYGSEKDLIKILFSEAPGVVVQIGRERLNEFASIYEKYDIAVYNIGEWIDRREGLITHNNKTIAFAIDKYRELWLKTSYLHDIRQSGEELALQRFKNIPKQLLTYNFPKDFKGKDKLYNQSQPNKNGDIVAAVIREKGTNGEREMAWSLYKAGFKVKDIHITDLISGAENLTDVNFVVFAGGFSNADTLGSAKGWAGAFQYNQKAKESIENFYNRKDTLSLGVCNGCQLMAELGFITPDNREESPKMAANTSNKYESAFIGVTVEESPSILLKSLEKSSLGIWIAHGEGRFNLLSNQSSAKVALRYNYNEYPANPNGSPDSIAALCSEDGRHLAMMPHPERCIYPHNWAYYPHERLDDEITPWFELFINAKEWIKRINNNED